jgi:hypothetical protein
MPNISAPTVRKRLLPFLTAGAVSLVSLLGLSPSAAHAATVTVFEHNGRTHEADNRFLTGPASNPRLPAAAEPTGPFLAPVADPLSAIANVAAEVARESHALSRATQSAAPQSFQDSLLQLFDTAQIPRATYLNDLSLWSRALTEEKQIAKWRRAQLTDVTALLDQLATRKQVTAARLPVLIVMLNRNAQYWRTGAKLVYPDRVQFAGSELVWQFYPGYGLQFQVLGTFGEGDGYYEAGVSDYPELVTLMNEVKQMEVTRAGGIAWEYYFDWEGGAPPWVSAMAQATGIEALTDAYLATSDHTYLTEAHDALGLFEVKPPVGTAVKTTLGTRYLQYSFAPKTDIINAYLQTLLGLYDYEQASLDPTALALYNAGNAQAQSELNSFIISGWSLYQPGVPDNLNYHELVTGFLKLLCAKTKIPVYCTTYQTFESDLTSKTKPVLEQLTLGVKPDRAFSLTFYLSKYASVGVQLTNGRKNFLYTKVAYEGGTRSFQAPKLKAGTYSLSMSATDPVGNYTKITGEVKVCASGCSQTIRATPVTTTTTTTTATTTTPTSTATSTTPSTTTPTTTTGTQTAPPATTTTGGAGL